MTDLWKPSSRKSHRKVRTGCRVCKQRKIKCDEQQPACNNCIRHSVQCDIMTTVLSRTSSHSPGLRREFSPSPNTGQIQSLNMIDLELLHHYSTSTCFSISSNPTLKTLWRINIPQLGFSYEYVMRGILAFAALHLGHFQPERREFYTSQAMVQHQTALQVVSPILSTVGRDDCSALYVFSVLICLFALASPRRSGDFLLVGEAGMAQWLFLLRGTKSIIELSSDILTSGNLGPMFSAGLRRVQLRDSAISGESNHLEELQHFFSTTCMDPAALVVYNASITELRMSFAVVSDANPNSYEMTDAFVWPFKVSDEYLSLLRQRRQEAFVILAYYCVLLKRLDSHWWMQGWGEHLIGQIYTLLDEEHRLWIRWPIEEIGWIPSLETLSPS